MKKFAVMKVHTEVNVKKLTTIENAVINDEKAEQIALVDTIEEARAILAKFSPFTREQKWVTRFYEVSGAYIEEGEYEYDEDLESWEFISGGDIWDV
jgi:hypothetical protein